MTNQSFTASRLLRAVIGDKREIDEGVFHKVSLVAFLAWVGLGADGLSSSAYGPEEAFKALGGETYLAIMLALATTLTVVIIAYSYSRIIEHFPLGGGGYIVASRLLGAGAGVTSGSALVIDYVLTISISIAAGGDAIFSFLHPEWSTKLVFGLFPLKLPIEFLAIVVLILLNLRGVKESVTALAPIFLTFLVTHAILIVGVILSRSGEIPVVVAGVREGFAHGLQSPPLGLGAIGMIALFLRAYSMGAGTYTGIEAVSNGLSIMREPKVQTGRRTMALMASSLALTAGGLIVAYLLAHVIPVEGKTMNAVLAEKFSEGMHIGGFSYGTAFVFVTLVSEAALLVVAAQAGFIDGPRVMANMASDSFLPHRFSQLSDRLTMHYGVLLMGGLSAAALWYTSGDVTHLVVMYSINVFVTFSLSQLAMCRFWVRHRSDHELWRRRLGVHVIALALCVFILCATVYVKFAEGGWVTLGLTAVLIATCFVIRRHYRTVQGGLNRLDDIVEALPTTCNGHTPELQPEAPTAVLLVGSYAGLGIHTMLSIERLFPRYFKNYVFVAVGVIDSASFTNVSAVDEVRERTQTELARYVELANRLGLAAQMRMAIDTEVLGPALRLCTDVQRDYPRSIFFAGKLVFERERWYQRLLHNETAYQLQRSLQFAGLNAMVLPTRVLETAA
ncbi:MAG TPA: APC family permease [Candidatus Binatia bacterium]|jgi:amino acid transporter